MNADKIVEAVGATSGPFLTFSNPSDDATGFQVDGNILLSFNERVIAGSGDIIISNGTDTRAIPVDDSNQVKFHGSRVTINPSEDLIPDTTYNIQLASGVITDRKGHAYAGISDDTTLDFTTTIVPGPFLTFSNPSDDATGFQVDDNIQMSFNERVVAGSGDIVISNGADTRTIAIDDSSQVKFHGSRVTINPSEDLISGTTYNIQLASGVITDRKGHAYAGINDDTTLDFTIIDTLVPLLSSSTPQDDSTEFKVDNDIVLGFNETVVAGSGDIVISNGTDTRTISVDDTSQVSFSKGKANNVTINPTEDLIPNTTYSVKMASGVIEDLAGNDYAGINDTTTFNFTTVASDPLLVWSNPWDDSTEFQVDSNIDLYFDEVVTAGSGDIIISNGTDTRTIAVGDASQVTFFDRVVTINPTADLIPNTTYNIQLAGGVIEDLSGNDYAGINDTTTLNFTTIVSDPLLVWSDPWDDSTFKIDKDIVLGFNEMVVAGSGDVIISSDFDTRTIDINDASQVAFDDYGNVIINPADDLILNTTYNIQMGSGVIEDLAGNDYAGISDPTTLNFTTINPEPLLIGSNPWDESALKIDSDIQLNFDEEMTAGSGAIIISNGSDTRTIDINDANQVTFNGSKVIINPIDDLIQDSSYSIQMANSVIVDTKGNAYAGINDPDTLNFTTIGSDPLLMDSNPWDDSAEFQVDSNINLYLDEVVTAGSGDIVISNGTDTRTIAVGDASQVTFFDSVVTINPTADLIPNTTYNIQLAGGVIEDLSGNDYAGINDTTTLNFTTIVSDPLLVWSDPWDDSTFKIGNDIVLSFNEVVIAGSGDVIISNGSDTRTIDISDTSQVTFDGYGNVMISPATDLILNTTYNIQLASGVIEDLAGNDYAGINDTTTLNFTTAGSDPLLVGGNPLDESVFKIDNDIQLYFDEMVAAGSGDIIISNGSDTRTIDINDSSQVSFNGYGGVTINLAADLILNASYNIQISSGAIIDIDGNPYEGISDPDTLNFTTINSDPLLVGGNPWDESTDFWVDSDIQFNFDETVTSSSGDIIISNGSDTRTIDINDASQVTFSGSKVIINPIDDLIPNTSYNIQIASDAITDTDGNPYAGISDPDTLNFTTINPPFIAMTGVALPDVIVV